VLTRATDYDGTPAGEITGGDFVYTLTGTLNGSKSYVMTNGTFTTLDVDDIDWTEFASYVPQLTTKGDIYTFTTETTRLPVGTNNQTLVADSLTASGLDWKDPTFLQLTDVPAAFTAASSIYAVNVAGNAVQETGTQLIDFGANRFKMFRGATIFDCQENLTVSSPCAIDQNLSTTSTITHAGLNCNGRLLIKNGNFQNQLNLSFDGTTTSKIGVSSGGNLIFDSTDLTKEIQFKGTADATALNNASVTLDGGLSVDKSVMIGGYVAPGTFIKLTNAAAPSTADAGTIRVYSDASGLVQSIDSSDVVVQLSNDTEVYIDAAYEFSGIWAAAQVINLRATRVGQVVTLSFSQAQDTANTAAAIAGVAIPVQFRPPEDLSQLIRIADNGVDVQGTFTLDTAGVVAVGVGYSTAVFTAANNGGTYAFSITYPI
jgi:hypothetical protein